MLPSGPFFVLVRRTQEVEIGSEHAMTHKEGIGHLTNDWYKDQDSGKICIDAEKAEAFLEAVGLGIKAMKALSAAPTEDQPLSLEQMREMGGQPYWHVGLQKDSPPPHWAILDPFYAQHIEDYGYGKRWLAYAYPPTRAKRETLNCAGEDRK